MYIMFTLKFHIALVFLCVPQVYNQDSNNITTLFIMSIFKTFFVLQTEVGYHSNQRVAVLMSCKNTEETVLAYDPNHLDYIVA